MLRRFLHLALLLAALACAAYAVTRANVPAAWAQLSAHASGRQRGLFVLALLLPAGIAAWLHTYGWIAAFGRRTANMGTLRMFAIRLAGEAVNQATPLLSLGGEPVKAVLYSASKGNGEHGAAAVIAARQVMTLSQVSMIVVGVFLSQALVPAKSGVFWAFGAFPAAVGIATLLFAAACATLPPHVRRRVAEHRWLAPHGPALRAAAHVLDFWRNHPGHCLGAFLVTGLAWIVPAAELWLVSLAVGSPISWEVAYCLEALVASVNMATFFIPGNLGSQEAGILYVAQLFGLGGALPPALLLVRRLREVVWIGIGFGCLAALGAGGILRRRPAPPAGEALANSGSPG